MNKQFTLIVLAPLALLISSCSCEMDIDQQCYRQGGSSMVGDLGNTGYRAATTNLNKGFQRVSFPSLSKSLDVDVSEMKLITKTERKVGASGEVAKNAVKLNSNLSTEWKSDGDMIIRIFEFSNPLELVKELNHPANKELRDHLKMRGSEARIISRVVRAYDASQSKSQTVAGKIGAKTAVGTPEGEIEYKHTNTSTKKVSDGTIVGYQWARIAWKKDSPDNEVNYINLDTIFLD
jgi:hypothetical protein